MASSACSFDSAFVFVVMEEMEEWQIAGEKLQYKIQSKPVIALE